MKLCKLTMLIFLGTALSTGQAAAGSIATHASEGSKHSVASVGHFAISTGQTVSAVAAVPLLVVGASAMTATAAGESLIESVHTPVGLEVTEITVTIDPAPRIAMENQKKVED